MPGIFFAEKMKLSSSIITKQREPAGSRRLQLWQIMVCLCVCAYLVLGAATHTLRIYHWFMLLAIPAAVFAAERGRRFFIDWMPLFAFWLGYDRLRLLQPYLLSRVTVELPFKIEQWMFGWLFAGDVPPHALRTWLASHAGEFFGDTISLLAQSIYLSHIIIFPALLFVWWFKSQWFAGSSENFTRYVKAFTVLHTLAILCYLLLPVAPPWWVSLYGSVQPSAEMLAQTHTSAAMDGAIVQRMIQTAPMWFGAVPSLHGAYPVLFFLLAWRNRKSWLLILIAVYALMMWFATVVLNQHYVIDLLAGAVAAFAAYKIAPKLSKIGWGMRTASPLKVLPKPD
jgi:inositol phosphorylceramide synthase catalytic subunit